MSDDIRKSQEAHWAGKFSEHGAAPAGVGSESVTHKELRYRRLVRLFEGRSAFSVLDVGAGVGDFYRYLRNAMPAAEFDFTGTEITADYAKLAQQRYPDAKFLHCDILTEPLRGKFDFVVLSGVFHQHFDADVASWEAYMHRMLKCAFSMATTGLGFNVLSSYAQFQREGNFHPQLSGLLDFIVSDLSRFFQIDHAIPLFEETIFVFQPDHIRGQFTEPELQKYFGEKK